ncbi:MAG: alpha/beta hydrolase [Deltaproteobacteria bacterium]|nr:alpha/beta hydrolase [Deltaproteobacteria bacterium]
MATSRVGTVQANGIRFSTLEQGDGPLVLCLHGFPDHAHSFHHQLPALAAAGFRAVAPFMRGYAPSDPAPDGRYQSAVLALDIVELITALGYESAHLFGHDWGALASYGAAIAAPNRVKKLVTAAVPHGPAVLNAFLTSYEQQRRSWYMFFFQTPFADAAVAHGEFAFLERLWRDWSPTWAIPPSEIDALKATFRQPGVLQAALAYYRCTLNPEKQDPELVDLQTAMSMAPIQAPSMVFHGAMDGCMGVDLLDGMEAMFPHGLRKVVVPGAGHFVHRERPDIVNTELIDFLRAD